MNQLILRLGRARLALPAGRGDNAEAATATSTILPGTVSS